jgi:hypothetical protein
MFQFSAASTAARIDAAVRHGLDLTGAFITRFRARDRTSSGTVSMVATPSTLELSKGAGLRAISLPPVDTRNCQRAPRDGS